MGWGEGKKETVRVVREVGVVCPQEATALASIVVPAPAIVGRRG